MARAEIYIEDTAEGGELALSVRYLGGADVKSGAHQVANLLRIYAESFLKPLEEPEFKTEAVEAQPEQKPS